DRQVGQHGVEGMSEPDPVETVADGAGREHLLDDGRQPRGGAVQPLVVLDRGDRRLDCLTHSAPGCIHSCTSVGYRGQVFDVAVLISASAELGSSAAARSPIVTTPTI